MANRIAVGIPGGAAHLETLRPWQSAQHRGGEGVVAGGQHIHLCVDITPGVDVKFFSRIKTIGKSNLNIDSHDQGM